MAGLNVQFRSYKMGVAATDFWILEMQVLYMNFIE